MRTRFVISVLLIAMVTVLSFTGMGQCAQSQAARSCSDILANGGSTGDAVYTIDPDGAGPGSPLDVYCDMTTDGGGWTLVGYGQNAILAGRLMVANGSYDPIGNPSRTDSANIAGLPLVHQSTEAALSWSDGFPDGNLLSYSTAVSFAIPDPQAQTLDPVDGGRACSDTRWTQVDVTCLSFGGSCGLPSQMYTKTASLGTAYGYAYGLVGPFTNTNCDWHFDSQGYVAAYLRIPESYPYGPSPGNGVVYSPGSGNSPHVPQTMAIWFRGAATTSDQCPDDPDKTEPGICGCGVADDDFDGDGAADCYDSF